MKGDLLPMEQEPDIPVYLFTGFMDAGKTKFIQETLEDKRFDTGERTLLIVCEEGEEEYAPDQFVSKKVMIRLDHVSKEYRLGAIGGGTLKGDLQSWFARIRGKEDPNLNLAISERKRGGLGIFMTKKFMDKVSYEYKDGMNILTIEKLF